MAEFIEEVEKLVESRKTSLSQVFHSVYELLRKEARDWFVPRKNAFQDWKDFKVEVKEDFLPINYEKNLLEEMRTRKSNGKYHTVAVLYGVEHSRGVKNRDTEPGTKLVRRSLEWDAHIPYKGQHRSTDRILRRLSSSEK